MVKGGLNKVTHEFWTVRLLLAGKQTEIVEYFFTETEALTCAKCGFKAYKTTVQKEKLKVEISDIK
jgi:hypothetical protein